MINVYFLDLPVAATVEGVVVAVVVAVSVTNFSADDYDLNGNKIIKRSFLYATLDILWDFFL